MQTQGQVSIDIFWNKASFGSNEELFAGVLVLLDKSLENFSKSFLTPGVTIVRRRVEMVDRSGHNSLLGRVIHSQIIHIVWITQVSTIANRTYFELRLVKRRFKIIRVHVKRCISLLRPVKVFLCTFDRAEAFERLWVAQEVLVEGVLYLVFIDVHVSEEVVHFASVRVDFHL